MADGDGRRVGEGFDRAAGEYDELLARNRAGAARLVAAIPPGTYADVLDVGCGTGFVSEEMVARFGTLRVTGVDPSAEMLERFAAKLDPLVEAVSAVRAGVLDMPVEDGAFDAVVTGMAFHWFADKPAAVAAMARRLRPGGILAILASGTGTDAEFLDVLTGVRPPVPAAWTEVFPAIQRDGGQLEEYIRAAGLEPVDVWEERRRRVADPDAYLARIAAVASHLSADLDPDEAAAHMGRVRDGVLAAAGPEGFAFTFVKLFGIARRPG